MVSGSSLTNTATLGLPAQTDDKPYSFGVTAQTFLNPVASPTNAYIEFKIDGSLMTNAAGTTVGNNFIGFATPDALNNISEWDSNKYSSPQGVWAASFGQKLSNSKQISIFADGGERIIVAKPQTVSSVSTINNTFTITGHPFTTGDLVRVTTTGVFPVGVSGLTDYFVSVIDANTIGLSVTPGDANIQNLIPIDSVGSGTITVSPQDTFRVERNGLTGFVTLKRNGTVIFTYNTATTQTLRGFYTSREAMNAATPLFREIKIFGGL